MIVPSPNFVNGLIGLTALSDGEPAELVPWFLVPLFRLDDVDLIVR